MRFPKHLNIPSHHRPHRYGALASAVLLLLTSTPFASAEVDKSYLNLSQKLVELRGRVSDLNTELQMLRDTHKLTMRGLMTQKNSVEAAIKENDMALQKMQEELINNKQLIQDMGADNESVRQALLLQTQRLKVYINSGIPFKLKERLADVESFEDRLKSGVMSPQKAVGTLWSMIEDELKLSSDNGVYRQPVTIDGKENLAHVAKLGSMLMYFRLNDDHYGAYRKTNKGWVAEVSKDSSKTEQIKKLFSSLEKQVHTGYFELPLEL